MCIYNVFLAKKVDRDFLLSIKKNCKITPRLDMFFTIHLPLIS